MVNKQVKEKTTDSKKICFLITPIGNENSSEFRTLNALLDNVINPVLEKYDYTTVVAHQIHKIGSIGDQVFNAIINSDLILSNLTGLNPNVMYETAVAHSFGKPTIMFAEQNDAKLPFDLIGDRVLFFSDTIEGTGKLISDLNDKIEHILSNPEVDNPIVRVLSRKAVAEDLLGKSDAESEVMKMVLLKLEDLEIEMRTQNRISRQQKRHIDNLKKDQNIFKEKDFQIKNSKDITDHIILIKEMMEKDLGRRVNLTELSSETGFPESVIDEVLNDYYFKENYKRKFK